MKNNLKVGKSGLNKNEYYNKLIISKLGKKIYENIFNFSNLNRSQRLYRNQNLERNSFGIEL